MPILLFLLDILFEFAGIGLESLTNSFISFMEDNMEEEETTRTPPHHMAEHHTTGSEIP